VHVQSLAVHAHINLELVLVRHARQNGRRSDPKQEARSASDCEFLMIAVLNDYPVFYSTFPAFLPVFFFTLELVRLSGAHTHLFAPWTHGDSNP